MKAQEFVSQLQREEIVRAIQEAETKTSGEIRVYISREATETPVTEAQNHFLATGMDKTRERNAVLLFVAPRTQKFAVVGDTGIHTRCGDEFWTHLSEDMTAHFKAGEYTQGLLKGICRAGELLAKHFPRQPNDRNELPDQVLGD